MNLHTQQAWVSSRMAELFQLAVANPTSETLLNAIHPEDRQTVREALQHATETETPFVVEHRIVMPDASLRWITTRGHRHCDPAGNPDRMMGVSVDITERRQAESEARRHLEELAHVNRVATMGELTASIAHELNQPLGAILRNAEAAEMMLQADLPDLEELRAIVTDIRKDNERAGNMIDRLRTLLKRRSLALQPVDLGRLVTETVSLARSDAYARHIGLEQEIPDDLPPVNGDRVHLQQVLLNLIMNAMDAMNQSTNADRRVIIRARRADDCLVEVAVSDSGPGISAEAISQVFEPFFTTKASGMGMGLAISRSIIEAHSGRIWADNNATHGATFRFTLTTGTEGEAG